jgi:large subunit ribosomal protein L23Ae
LCCCLERKKIFFFFDFFFFFFSHHQPNFTRVNKKKVSVADSIIASQNRVVDYRAKHAEQIAKRTAKRKADKFSHFSKAKQAVLKVREERLSKLKADGADKKVIAKTMKKHAKADRAAKAAAIAEKKKVSAEKAKKVVADKAKADKAKKAVQKGNVIKRTRKERYSVRFRRPHTLRLPSAPKYPRKSTPGKQALGRVLDFALPAHDRVGDEADRGPEHAHLCCRCARLEASDQGSCGEVYQIKVDKVRTLIRPDNQKKAFVRLAADYDALDVASKINIV